MLQIDLNATLDVTFDETTEIEAQGSGRGGNRKSAVARAIAEAVKPLWKGDSKPFTVPLALIKKAVGDGTLTEWGNAQFGAINGKPAILPRLESRNGSKGLFEQGLLVLMPTEPASRPDDTEVPVVVMDEAVARFCLRYIAHRTSVADPKAAPKGLFHQAALNEKGLCSFIEGGCKALAA